MAIWRTAENVLSLCREKRGNAPAFPLFVVSLTISDLPSRKVYIPELRGVHPAATAPIPVATKPALGFTKPFSVLRESLSGAAVITNILKHSYLPLKQEAGIYFFWGLKQPNNTDTASPRQAKAKPTPHTPVHPAQFHAIPAQSVPRLPPAKRWLMKMVLLRLVAPGTMARQPLWLLSW